MTCLNPARSNLLKTFALDTEIVRATGFRLYDSRGREYLDFLSQYGAVPFGHNSPEIWDALSKAQNDQIASMIQPLRSVSAENLAEKLAAITPGDLSICTFTNSGAETVEAAIKLARVHSGRDRILSTWNGFHGKTLGALSATGKPVYQIDFAAPVAGFDYVPYGDLAALEACLVREGDQIAAFIFEPIQGEGGVIVPETDYLEGAIRLCRKYGVLSILDEIQTGLGRTGDLFVCSSASECPDMLLLAKALGGGIMPIGACIVRPSAWDDRFGLLHSSTFAGNSLACTVASAVLDRLLANDRALIASVKDNGIYLHARLKELQHRFPSVIRDVRGRGYMMGLEFQRFDQNKSSAMMAFSSLNGGVTALISSFLFNVCGVLTAPLFNDSHVLRLQPPLIAGRDEIDRAIRALTELAEILHRGDFRMLVRHLVKSAPSDRLRLCDSPEQPERRRRRRAARMPGRFGFMIHYTEEEDICRADPSFRQFTPTELKSWVDWVKQLGPGYAHRISDIVSATGASADGWLMSVPLLPEDMMGKHRNFAAAMINDAIDTAARDGVSRIGLGAFTSIATRGGRTATGRGVAITSGNTLTSVAAFESLCQIAPRAGIKLSEAHVVIVGATGAIGRLLALMSGRCVGQLTLIGNPGNPLAPTMLSRVADDVTTAILAEGNVEGPACGGLAVRIRDAAGRAPANWDLGPRDIATRLVSAIKSRSGERPLRWSTDLPSALLEADIVIVATNSAEALIDPVQLRPGTLVCDIARPPNVRQVDLAGRGVLVFDGGLVRPPSELDLGPFQTLPKGLCWGCLGETILLSVARQERDFSIGPNLSLTDAELLSELAKRHGFEPAPPQWYGNTLTETAIAQFARTREVVPTFPRRDSYANGLQCA